MSVLYRAPARHSHEFGGRPEHEGDIARCERCGQWAIGGEGIHGSRYWREVSRFSIPRKIRKAARTATEAQ